MRYQKEILYQDYSTSCGRGASCHDFEPSRHPGALVISNTKFLLATRSPIVVYRLPVRRQGWRNGSKDKMRTQKQKPSKERRWDSAWKASKEGFVALFPWRFLASSKWGQVSPGH